MKSLSFALLLLLVLFMCSVARAQSPSNQTIERLKDEIARREVIDRDESTPNDLKAMNRRILDQRRDELVAAIQARINAVQKYLDTLGATATEEEKQSARDSLRNASAATDGLRDSASDSSARTDPATRTAAARNPNPANQQSLYASFLRHKDNQGSNDGDGWTASADDGSFRIAYPTTDDSPVGVAQIEVKISLDAAIGFDLNFGVVVKDKDGKEGDKKTIAIKANETSGKTWVTLKEGKNTIVVNQGAKTKTVELMYTPPTQANADAADSPVATLPSNSRFTRAIVGIEQAGASSAESKSNPFLDFFFTTPLKFKAKDDDKEPTPRFGAWGQVRFSTTPEQTSSFAVFPSNFVNQATDPTKVVNLVQSFDFLAGVELRAYNANGWIWSLIPGIKQKTSLYFTFGGGAISPLSVKRESAQLFNVPADATSTAPADPRRTEFIRRFGDPKTLKYVGFVPLERDRFFRQYYAGIRLKTHYCKNEHDNCDEYRNRFPSIVDFGIGQNEAVTGGRLKSDVRDAANNLIRRRRAWVMRLDAFFPLPFKEANFLYLYGTALMKVGGGGVKIQTPLFLDTPASTVQITDPNVYLPPADLQPTRVDRDYYKIGIGVNLTDLFNKNKPKQ